MSEHILPVRTNLAVFAALMALLVVTIGAAYAIPAGWGVAVPVALAIATVKAALILLYFMHVRFSSRLTWVFAGAAFAWLALLIAFALADYLSRGWLSIAGK